MSIQQTSAPDFLLDLSGNFHQQLGTAISHVANGVANHGNRQKKGQIVITLDLEKMGDGDRVNVKHKLFYKEPHAKGKRTDELANETPMYVNNDSTVTLHPSNQVDWVAETQGA